MAATKRRVIVAVAIGVFLVGGVLGIKYGRYYVIPKRFAVVESGRVYRSGYLEPWPLKRIIREHQIKTILTLMNDEPDSPEQQKENSVVAREGVRLIRVSMPGDGCSQFELLDKAADVIADESNRPLLVHCAAGVNRTGAALAAWQLKYRGWSFDKVLAESEKQGYPLQDNPPLVEHLRQYQQCCVLSTRPESRPR